MKVKIKQDKKSSDQTQWQHHRSCGGPCDSQNGGEALHLDIFPSLLFSLVSGLRIHSQLASCKMPLKVCVCMYICVCCFLGFCGILSSQIWRADCLAWSPGRVLVRCAKCERERKKDFHFPFVLFLLVSPRTFPSTTRLDVWWKEKESPTINVVETIMDPVTCCSSGGGNIVMLGGNKSTPLLN